MERKMKDKVLKVAHSPDPDDAFMFHGLADGAVKLAGWRVSHVLKDIQSLNRDARRRKYHVTAVSTAAYPSIAADYWILTVGSSIGRKYGPIVVTTPEKAALFRSKDWSKLKIATPGPETTALLLLRLYRKDFVNKDMRFDKIIDAVQKGTVDGGLIIHEGQITYKNHGLVKIVDMGRWWHDETRLPIPLGLDVVRKDMGRSTARAAARALRDSILHAYKHRREAVRYALQYGRGIDHKTGDRFVRMYVNRDTLDMGDEGKKAVRELLKRGRQAGLVPKGAAPSFIAL